MSRLPTGWQPGGHGAAASEYGLLLMYDRVPCNIAVFRLQWVSLSDPYEPMIDIARYYATARPGRRLVYLKNGVEVHPPFYDRE